VKRAKKYGRYGGYRKFCSHARREWDLCACAWFYTVTHQGQRQRGKIPGARSEDEAKRAYNLIAARVRAGQPAFEPVAPADGPTVKALGDEWLSLPRDRKASVIDSYRGHLRAHIYPVLGTRVVSEVAADECEHLVVNLTPKRFERPLAWSTKRSVARTLHALFSFAISKKRRADNPCDGLVAAITDPDVSPDVAIDPQDHTRYFKAEEARHLLATCRATMPRWYPFLLTALQTGMRLGELRALRYDRINWRGGYINVDRNFVDGQWTSPKNRKSRTVSMSRDLRAVLYVRWRAHRRDELIFPSRVGTPLETSRLQRFWQRLLTAAELDYRKFHALRHTHTSLLLQNGVPPAKVAEEAGRSVEETMRTYAHFLPGGNRADAEVLAGLLTAQDGTSFRRDISGSQRPRTATNLRRVS
jgi:integrase